MTSTTSPSTSPGTSSGTTAHRFVRRSGSTPTRGRGRRTGLVGGLVGAALLLMGTPAVAADGGPGGRRLVDHTVRAGETATGLAVRYHAWTAELISHNHLGSSAALHVGQHVEIPVVVAALRHRAHRAAPHHRTHRAAHHHLPDPRTATVRRAVAGAAHRAGVDPHLALAVAWQESGWQMDRRSGAGAIGAMQVLPGTGRWMSLYAGRPLHLRRLGDNATAGTTLLRVLDRETPTTRRAIGAYYQGLGAVREHGLYRDTRSYVANVTAIRDRLEAGRPPA
jgi:LysM repeat protein